VCAVLQAKANVWEGKSRAKLILVATARLSIDKGALPAVRRCASPSDADLGRHARKEGLAARAAGPVDGDITSLSVCLYRGRCLCLCLCLCRARDTPNSAVHAWSRKSRAIAGP
jgi:hypothetical protein